MKKSIFKKIGGLFLGLAMGLGVVTGVAAGNKASEVKAAGGTFKKITSTSDLTSGAKYLIVSDEDKVAFDGSLGTIDAVSNTKTVTISSSDSITTTADFYFTITSKTGGYSIKGSGGKYVGSTSSNANELKNGTSDSYTNTITWDADKSCFIIRGTNSYLVYNSSSGQTRFRFFKPGTCGNGAGSGSYHKISLFKEQSVTKYTVSFNMQGHGTAPSAQTIEAGGNVVKPTAPSVSGYIFGEWYKEAECNNLWDFTKDTVSANTTLYAKWTAKTALTLTAANVNMKLGDSNESVTVTAGGSTVTGYTLASGNTNVISIVNNQLHVVGLGDATITITKAEDADKTYTSGTFNVHVDYADITSFELDYTEGTLGKGGEATLPGVTILPANANQAYSWGNAVATEGIIYTYNPSTHELAIDANNTVEGTIQFTATATGDLSKTATVVYTVQAAQIAHITGVTASATGTIVAKQYVGDAFNPQGFSFAPTWSEGDHDVVVINANDISWNALVAGSNPTGTYLCADGEFTVTITGVTVVNDTLASIAFAEGCDMTNKSYYVGDSWDFSGLSIVGTMDSGTTAPAISSSNVTFSSDDAVATTTTSITVTATYQELTATKVISGIVVNEVTMNSLTVNYTGGQPILGTDFTFAGSITANMSNGTHPTVNLSDVTIGSVDKFTTNQQTITVTHKNTGATGTFNVQYKAKSYSSTTTEEKTLIVRASDVGGTNNSYALKDWTVGGVSGKSYTYASTSSASAFQFNGSKGTNIFYNTSAIPGKIKSVKMTKSSGTDRGGVEVFVHTSAMTSSNYTSGTSLGSKTVTSAGVTWGVPTTNTNNNVYLYVHYPTGNALYVSQVEITYEKTTTVTSSEKHAIRIADVACSKSPLIAGETISKSDFKIQVQYDTGTALTSNLTTTSVSPTTLVAGTHDYTITYTGSYNDTVTKVIQLTAQEPAVLDSISIVKDSGCDDVFTRNDAFTHNGIHVIAHYTDSTTYPDADVTADADIPAPSNMNVAGTKTINVSYEENGVIKTTSYQITVNPIVSTYLTLSGEGIEGSNGVYTLKSGVENEVQLTIDKDGDEEIQVTNPTTFLSFDKTSSILTVNSQTTTSESGTIAFTAGSLTASLTVNVSAAEGIQNLGDEEIDTYVGSSFTHNINIKLNNVESAEWTLPQGNFVITTTTKDETGLVGTIYFTDEVLDTLTFSALTGKGKTLSVEIDVLAVNDDIKSISASLKSGVTYTAGQGQTFSKDDLTVTYERDSGANGTLLSSEFTVSGLPEGSFNRVASYPLTITSVENTEATDSVTISVGMPEGENLVTSSTSYTPGTPTTSWSKLTAANQLDANEKVYIYNSTSGYITGDNGSKDATVSKTASDRIEFVIKDLDTTSNTFKLFNSSTQKYITYYSGNQFAIGTTETNKADAAIFKVNKDGNFQCFKGTSKDKFLCTNGNYLRMYDAVGNYTPFDLYISKTTPGQGTYNTTYSNNAMTATLYNFIAKANEVYADICGSEENNQKPDLTTWRSVLGSDEYEALVADTNSYNLLKSAICGEGAYGSNGRYVPDGDKQSSDMVIEFLQKYDRVVSNYPSENYNYLGRDVASPSPRINPILALNEVDNSVWIISAVALVGLTAIGGYFFYRKRKEI